MDTVSQGLLLWVVGRLFIGVYFRDTTMWPDAAICAGTYDDELDSGPLQYDFKKSKFKMKGRVLVPPTCLFVKKHDLLSWSS